MFSIDDSETKEKLKRVAEVRKKLQEENATEKDQEFKQFTEALCADGSSEAIGRAIDNLYTNVECVAAGTKKKIEESLGATEDENENEEYITFERTSGRVLVGDTSFRRKGAFLVVSDGDESDAILVTTITHINVESSAINIYGPQDCPLTYYYNPEKMKVKTGNCAVAIAKLLS